MVKYPDVNDGKALAEKYGIDGVIIISVRAEDENFGVTSYGSDRDFCVTMNRLGEVLSNAIASWADAVITHGGERPER